MHQETTLQQWAACLTQATQEHAALATALATREATLAQQVKRLAEEHASLEQDAVWLEEQQAVLEEQRAVIASDMEAARELQARAADAGKMLEEACERMQVCVLGCFWSLTWGVCLVGGVLVGVVGGNWWEGLHQQSSSPCSALTMWLVW